MQHLLTPLCCCTSFPLLPPSTPKAPHRSAPPCKTSLLLPKGIPSSLGLSTHLISQLHVPPCDLWVFGCAPHTFTPLHTYLSTPACKCLLVADLTYLVLPHCVPLNVLMTMKALLSISCQTPGTAQLAVCYSSFTFWGPLRRKTTLMYSRGQILK